jgi:hypothetical protein
MKRSIILACIIGLLLISPAYSSTLNNANLAVNGNFSSSTPAFVTDDNSGNLSANTWYVNTFARNSTNQNATYTASFGGGTTGYIYQLIDTQGRNPSFVPHPGTVEVTFDITITQQNLSSTGLALYGIANGTTVSENQVGSSGSSVGTQLLSNTTFTGTAGTRTVDITGNAQNAYRYYLVWIKTTTGADYSSPYPVVTIDNVTARVTPIPAAAWLLGSGLIGLVAIRRRKAMK